MVRDTLGLGSTTITVLAYTDGSHIAVTARRAIAARPAAAAAAARREGGGVLDDAAAERRDRGEKAVQPLALGEAGESDARL